MWSERRRQARAGLRGEGRGGGIEQVGEGAVAGAADAAADLVGLGQSELVGALGDQGVGRGDVEARLDDRRRHQAVGVTAQEAQHRLLQLAVLHATVGLDEAGPRHQGAQPLGHLVQGLDPVV